MARRLTGKQLAFIDEYIQCLNATEAAERAGYRGTYGSLRVIGSTNLTKANIRAEIDRRLKARTMTADEVLARLSDQARGIPAECVIAFGPLISIDVDKLRLYGLLHLIKKLSYDRNENPVIELYDAQAALVQLGKYYKLFTEHIQVDDWRTEAVEYIRRGEISYEALADGFGPDLATQLFAAAGIPVEGSPGAPADGGA